MDVGTTLRTARERSGLAIEDVAASTRITVALLHAIERNAFDKVPSGIFARGFIRSFAREVGLDPEEMVAQFLEETGDAPAVDEQVAEAQIDDEIRVIQIDPEPRSNRATWGYGLIVAALLVAFISSTRAGGSGNDITPAVAAADTERTTGTATDAAVEPAAPPGLLRFDIAPSAPCWVEAVADRKTIVYRLMQPGERQTIFARQIALRVGDPASFAYQINGRRGRLLGPPGTPVSITITADSPQSFYAN